MVSEIGLKISAFEKAVGIFDFVVLEPTAFLPGTGGIGGTSSLAMMTKKKRCYTRY